MDEEDPAAVGRRRGRRGVGMAVWMGRELGVLGEAPTLATAENSDHDVGLIELASLAAMAK